MGVRALFVLLSVLPTVSSSLQSQSAKSKPPEERIPFFAGDWTFTGKMGQTVFGADQTESRLVEKCEMVAPLFLACR